MADIIRSEAATDRVTPGVIRGSTLSDSCQLAGIHFLSRPRRTLPPYPRGDLAFRRPCNLQAGAFFFAIAD